MTMQLFAGADDARRYLPAPEKRILHVHRMTMHVDPETGRLGVIWLRVPGACQYLKPQEVVAVYQRGNALIAETQKCVLVYHRP